MAPSRPPVTDVGIQAMSLYIPRTAVSQAALEAFDHTPTGKYTLGLGQAHMSFVSDREDVVSLALTAVAAVVRDAQIPYEQIGRLEVGTETIVDKSKSIKTALMQLFEDSGNAEVEGLDNTNACYGGTAALFNSLAWMESSAWDGRYAVVVAADIAVYEPGPARPTGGAAAVAMLLGKGPKAALRFEIGLRSTAMGNTYDFFKPHPAVEYPVVKGQETVDTFVRAMDDCYDRYRARAKLKDGRPFDVATGTDYVIFHAPFNKMVVKSFARLLFADFLASAEGEKEIYKDVERWRGISRDRAHYDREVIAAFVKIARPMYERQCKPAAWIGVEIGNCYTASLYSQLAALLYEKGDEVVGKRVLMYSFGSGFAASMFSMRVVGEVEGVVGKMQLREVLRERVVTTPEEYAKCLERREENYCRVDYVPEGEVEELFPGTFYLKRVGKQGEREYDLVPFR
ncbi:unnamed protein product [Chondrus crispus]|uniref:Hydroxymethylglutaryl-CoA synthase n=1 Tax=Chondrus crispus TaxID=2769 RepID=R7Q398_CHOCR|nr:unnamed protein product [Chondrus crispus]CDF32383.1 unnamed protein product [Chondrus crispus]|eukprot:XP_005712048.1 unnamed protein product [Chondrus crispus]